MMENVEPEDWSELIQTLRIIEKNVCSLDTEEEFAEKVEACRQALKSFHTTAGMLGMQEVETAGLGLEASLKDHIASGKSPDSIYAFGFAVNTLAEQMTKASCGEIDRLNAGEVLKVLDSGREERKAAALEVNDEILADEAAIREILGSPDTDTNLNVSRLEKIVTNLGGVLLLKKEEGRSPTLELKFEAHQSMVDQIETLLSPSDPSLELAPELSSRDARHEKILGTVKEFMLALSSGDLERAQGILLSLAEQQYQAGLYKEIGMMARELHNSLRGFMGTLDPALKEIVENRLPDSGNRLEHILEITERAANTTLDYVERMQKRNHLDQERVDRLVQGLGILRAIGEQAHQRLSSGLGLAEELQASILESQQDLVTILTAQDFQDLTGQVIQKIIKLLKDLELKLVNVIRVFGVKVEGGKKPEVDQDLYGPAHKEKDGALHSQDDVDALLAEFGF